LADLERADLLVPTTLDYSYYPAIFKTLSSFSISVPLCVEVEGAETISDRQLGLLPGTFMAQKCRTGMQSVAQYEQWELHNLRAIIPLYIQLASHKCPPYWQHHWLSSFLNHSAASNMQAEMNEIWNQAHAYYYASLNDRERRQVEQVGSQQSLLAYTRKLEKQYSSYRVSQYLTKMQTFVAQLVSFSAIINIFVQSDPHISALVWGPLALILEVSTRHSIT
jgi:hypothetical protein